MDAVEMDKLRANLELEMLESIRKFEVITGLQVITIDVRRITRIGSRKSTAGEIRIEAML